MCNNPSYVKQFPILILYHSSCINFVYINPIYFNGLMPIVSGTRHRCKNECYRMEWMGYFRSRFCTCKAILGRGQPECCRNIHNRATMSASSYPIVTGIDKAIRLTRVFIEYSRLIYDNLIMASMRTDHYSSTYTVATHL